jgi:apolipoprotein N-acyltransferase
MQVGGPINSGDHSSNNSGGFGNGPPPLDDPNLAFLAAIVGVINITLLLVMLSIYLTSYRRLKSPFTLGLIVFTTLLIFQNLLFIVFLLVREGFHGPGMGVPVLSLNIVQFGALLALLKITWD